jgi:hypothetical protein
VLLSFGLISSLLLALNLLSTRDSWRLIAERLRQTKDHPMALTVRDTRWPILRRLPILGGILPWLIVGLFALGLAWQIWGKHELSDVEKLANAISASSTYRRQTP